MSSEIKLQEVNSGQCLLLVKMAVVSVVLAYVVTSWVY